MEDSSVVEVPPTPQVEGMSQTMNGETTLGVIAHDTSVMVAASNTVNGACNGDTGQKEDEEQEANLGGPIFVEAQAETLIVDELPLSPQEPVMLLDDEDDDDDKVDEEDAIRKRYELVNVPPTGSSSPTHTANAGATTSKGDLTASWVDTVLAASPVDTSELDTILVPSTERQRQRRRRRSSAEAEKEGGERATGEEEVGVFEPIKKRARAKASDAAAAAASSKRAEKEIAKAATEAEEAATRVFRHSQRALRKEAKSVSIKDIFSRSLTTGLVTEPGAESYSNPFSPTSIGSPTTPSVWSPTMVGDITTQFLASVQTQKRRTFERLLPRELTQSQNSQSMKPHHATGSGASLLQHQSSGMYEHSASSAESETAVLDELIIGEEDEDANLLPPGDSRDFIVADSAITVDGGELSRSTSNLDSLFSRLPSYMGNGSAFSTAEADAKAKEAQQQEIKALTRKHEMWKLRQRQIRAEKMLEVDKKSATTATPAAGGGGDSQSAAGRRKGAAGFGSLSVAASNREMRSLVETKKVSSTSVAGTTAGGDAPAELFHSVTHHAAFRVKTSSITSTSLSMDDISMIRRLNSFENTSSQRPVVFTTVQSKDENTESKGF